MSNAAILYLRLLRRIVRESAWRLGGADEIFLASGLSGSDTSASIPRRPWNGMDGARTPRSATNSTRSPVVCGGPVERDSNARS